MAVEDPIVMVEVDLYKIKNILYVRGGMGIEWEMPEARDVFIQAILTGGGHPVVESLTPAERVELAVSFISGWAQHRGAKEKPEPFVIHRLVGQTQVQVLVC